MRPEQGLTAELARYQGNSPTVAAYADGMRFLVNDELTALGVRSLTELSARLVEPSATDVDRIGALVQRIRRLETVTKTGSFMDPTRLTKESVTQLPQQVLLVDTFGDRYVVAEAYYTEDSRLHRFLEIIDPTNGERIATTKQNEESFIANLLGVTPDGRVMAKQYKGMAGFGNLGASYLVFWNPTDGSVTPFSNLLDSESGSMHYSRERNQLYYLYSGVNDDVVSIYDVATGKWERKRVLGTHERLGGVLSGVAADGRLITSQAVGDQAQTVRVIDLDHEDGIYKIPELVETIICVLPEHGLVYRGQEGRVYFRQFDQWYQQARLPVCPALNVFVSCLAIGGFGKDRLPVLMFSYLDGEARSGQLVAVDIARNEIIWEDSYPSQMPARLAMTGEGRLAVSSNHELIVYGQREDA